MKKHFKVAKTKVPFRRSWLLDNPAQVTYKKLKEEIKPLLESRSDNVSPASCWLVTVKVVNFYGVRGNKTLLYICYDELDEPRFYLHAFQIFLDFLQVLSGGNAGDFVIKGEKVTIKDHLSH